MLGSAVYDWLRNSPVQAVGTTRGAVRVWYERDLVLYNPQADPSIFRIVSAGDYVVNCIGLIRQKAHRYAASDMVYLNSVFPHVLANQCASIGARLIHASTDSVFSGDDGTYNEHDVCTAEDPYGRSKRMGEPGGCLVIRTSVIGREQHSFTSLVEWFLRQDGPVRGYTNHLWNGITTVEWAKMVERMVAGGLYEEGVRHVHSSDVTKYDILVALKGRYGRATEIVPAEADVALDRRLRTVHPSFLVALAIPDFDEMVRGLP